MGERRCDFMSCEECMNEHRIKTLEDDDKKNIEAHRNFYDRFEDMKVQMAVQGRDFANCLSKLDEISRDVKDIKQTPSKRYEQIISCVITALIGGIIGIMLSGLF